MRFGSKVVTGRWIAGLIAIVAGGLLAAMVPELFSLKTVVKIMLAGGFVALLFIRLEWAFWLFILLVCWLPSRYNQEILMIGRFPLNFYDPLLGLLLVAWMVERLARRQPLRWSWDHVWLLGMLALVLISALTSLGYYREPVKLWSGILDWFRMGLFFVLAYDLLKRSPDLSKYFYVLAAASFVIAAYGIYSYFFVRSDFSFASGPIKAFSFEKRLVVGSLIGGGATTLAGFLILTTPPVFAHWLKTKAPLERLVLPGVFATQLFMLILTFSRGGWMSTSIGLLLTLTAMMKKPVKLVTSVLIFVTLLLLVWQVLPPEVHDRLATAFNPKHKVNEERVFIWHEAMERIQRHPWLGSGPNNFYGTSIAYDVATQFIGTYHPHNWIILTTVEFGLLGAAVFFAYLLAVVVRAFLALRRLPPEQALPFRYGVWAGVIGFSLHSQVDYFLWQPRMNMVFWLLILLLSLLGSQRAREPERVPA